MKIVLAICLSIAGGADPGDDKPRSAAALDQDVAAAAARMLASLDREIDEASGDPTRNDGLAKMYATRGWLRLQKGDVERARSDFEAALALDPRLQYARSGRAEYFRRTGQPALAESEMRQVIWPHGTPGNARPSGGDSGQLFGTSSISPVEAWLILGLAWLAATILNIVVGWRQKVEASGSLARLLWIAACLAAIEVLPLAVWVAFVSSGGATDVQLRIAAGATVLSALLTTGYLKPPVRLRGTKEKLPRIMDELFLARVAELADKMKVPMPIVRLWPSITGSQQALAFAGTIQAPQLVVTDGILRRLATAERDAIVAHELAHVANGSLWVLATVLPVSCAAATLASAFVPQSIVWPFSLAFLVGLRRLVSRPYEIDCDRRAARAIGFRETTAALAKIHAVHPIRNSGLLSLLVYATATHPSREIRLAALRAAAPESDRPAIELSEPRIRWQRRLTIAALVVWLATVSGTMAGAILKPQLEWLAIPLWPIPLWTVALAPLALIGLAQRKRQAVVRKRMGRRPAWIVGLIIGGLVGVMLLLPQSSHDAIDPIPLFGIQLSIETSLLALACLVGIFVWFQWTNGRRKLRHAVAVACQVHDFRRVLELGQQSPKVVSRDHILRYNVALARAICDDRPAAIAMLEGLWQEKPRFPLTAFILCQLLLDGNQPERALAIAQSIVEQLPGDAGTHALEARVRRRLGQLDEAQAACDRLRALEPEQGIGYGISAAIALDRGDLPRAQELIAQALAASPGEAYLLVIQAEIALQTEPLEAARAAVEQALSAVRSNPLVFLQADLSRLEQKLWEREGSAPIF